MLMEWKYLIPDSVSDREGQSDGNLRDDDYDAIICSALFRRLQDKAQVFPLDDDDYVRTRLTHSLEVSAIGKKLGEYVFRRLREAQKDPWFDTHSEKSFSDVLLCAGLVHDIGNPPFGHFGEYAIREWFQNNIGSLRMGERQVCDLLSRWQIQDLLSFEGNAQSLRLLSGTPYLGDYHGLNLSHSVLAAIIKYPVSAADLLGKKKGKYKKIGYNYSEREVYSQIDQNMRLQGNRHPLSFLLEAADDIAYRTSDLEDAVVKKVITYKQIAELFQQYKPKTKCTVQYDTDACQCMSKLSSFYQEEVRRGNIKAEFTAIQRWSKYIQAIMLQDAAESFVRNYSMIMEGTFSGDLFDNTFSGYLISAISEMSEKLIYTSTIKTRPELFGRKVIHSLLDQFMPAAILYDSAYEMTFIEKRTIDSVSSFYKSMYTRQATGKSEQDKLYLRILMITDYISGMTDSYAKRLYQQLNV